MTSEENLKLSIITPVYQGERNIAACIESVINQGCGSIEHIIIDGASTDRTVDIIQSYAKQNAHIKFISEKDSGQSAAMNKGMRLATGQIVGVLNADDYYEPKALNTVIELMSKQLQPCLVVGNCFVRDESGRILSVNKPKRLHHLDLLLGWSINPFPVNPSAYFYHRSLHAAIGYYKEEEHFVMDFDFLLRAVLKAKVIYVDVPLGNFALTKDSKTYKEIQNGNNTPRVEELLDAYLSKLPKYQQWWVRLLRMNKNGYYFYRIRECLNDPTLLVHKIYPWIKK